MHKRIFSWTMMMLLALSLTRPCTLRAETGESLKVFLALGKGVISRSNIPDAKDKAVKEGLNTAVEEALFYILSDRAVAAHFEAVTEILTETPATYIDGYKVVAERRFGSYYHVAVEASVAMDRLEERLTSSGIVLEGSDKPKLLFLVSEKLPDSTTFDYWWGPGMSYIATVSDEAIAGTMAKRGFEVLPHRAIIDDAAPLGPDGLVHRDEALRIGAAFGADVVVVGRAWTEPSGNIMGDERSFRASVELEGFVVGTDRATDGVLRASVAVGTDPGKVSTRAMTDAARDAGRDLSALIVDAMKEKKSRTTMIEVVVEGTNFFENFTQLSREMEGLKGVISVRPRERRIERAVMVVNFTGEGKLLAEQLLSRTYKGFSITLSEVSRDHIKVDMVAGGKNTFMQ
ncbi:hypothetical protein [Desulfoluna spongiiphila]|uniref:Flagellar assembly protein T N-terminal domain-containing protein n=1 Tax=Desulfoluna spongiiphila TaxID=419481 RepID=A0A1G5GUP2_9BACT|nr:hypothetical protein [Desulfoluna spongiiphila]SCY55087.1 hypothetical protein SAMN05216233_111140 [Desulfoluna spongiiphila]